MSLSGDRVHRPDQESQLLERLENRPLAVKVRDIILEAILAERFDGGRLPSEDELASMLNVSRTTIRTALHSLEQDGIVTRRRALGTTINTHAPDLVALQRLAGFDWLLREKGHQVEVDVTSTRSPITDELRELFGCDDTGECLLTEKLFFADGELAIYVRDLVPWEEISKPPRGKLSPSLFEFSARHLRKAIDHAIVEIEPAVKRSDETTRLTLARGEPFARLHERHFSVDGRSIAYSVIDVDDKFIRFEVFRRQ